MCCGVDRDDGQSRLLIFQPKEAVPGMLTLVSTPRAEAEQMRRKVGGGESPMGKECVSPRKKGSPAARKGGSSSASSRSQERQDDVGGGNDIAEGELLTYLEQLAKEKEKERLRLYRLGWIERLNAQDGRPYFENMKTR